MDKSIIEQVINSPVQSWLTEIYNKKHGTALISTDVFIMTNGTESVTRTIVQMFKNIYYTPDGLDAGDCISLCDYDLTIECGSKYQFLKQGKIEIPFEEVSNYWFEKQHQNRLLKPRAYTL